MGIAAGGLAGLGVAGGVIILPFIAAGALVGIVNAAMSKPPAQPQAKK
jgi:hypothetical protein